MTEASADEPIFERDTASVAPTSLAEFLERYDRLAAHAEAPGPRYRIGHTVLGAGPPIYLVPGICCTRRVYAPLAVELAKSFRVVQYDLPGIAEGDGADLKRYAVEDYPSDLFHLADHLGDDRFAVIGHSFGVSVSLRSMHVQPDRVPKAILAGGFAHRPLEFAERMMVRTLGSLPGSMGRIPMMNAVTRYNHGRELRFREEALVDFLVREVGSTKLRTAAAQALAVHHTDLRELAPEIRSHALILHGYDDRVVTTAHAAELANSLPNVEIMLVPRCGHNPQLNRPELMAHAAQRLFETEESS